MLMKPEEVFVMDESALTLNIVDGLLTSAHLVVIAINVLAWIPKATRVLHRVVFGLTIVSWFVCGYWKGWGYCFLTDIQWSVKRTLGERDVPHSFIDYVLQKYLGLNWPATVIDTGVLSIFVILLCIFVWQGIMDLRKQGRAST